MFCPPEYVHIHKVLEVCKRAARVHLPIDEASEHVYNTDDKTTLDPVKSKVIERKVIEQQMVKLALSRYSDNAFALSPRQQPVRLSHKIVSLTKPVWCISRSSDPHVRVELFYIYPPYAKTRKLSCEMTRKLSEMVSRKLRHSLGRVFRKNASIASANCFCVG
ncbi:hypothetical protein BD293_1048 [Roseinatronobacter monicus]|uniref:Uncharacterized protein n=1 Tax=Roseinatronobacter monicus TaxID=393481 RepID=A0A543KBH4_9RHOB|nr:hypothetical protein BD293_1048 [Roseinatronobacter monicus]